MTATATDSSISAQQASSSQVIVVTSDIIATRTNVIASDAGGAYSSTATTGQKLLQDSYGKMIAVYVDSSGRIAVTYANSDPTVGGSWALPTKTTIPTVPYSSPSAVLASSSSLRIVVMGGTATGQITDIPVTLKRDSSFNIVGLSFGSSTLLDGSGKAKYPTAILAHNGDILAAWWVNGTDSRVKSFRWKSGVGWMSFTGSSLVPDDAIVDSSNILPIIPNIIERPDNYNVYLIGNRAGSGAPYRLVFNKATFDGSNWAWGVSNLAFESNASTGIEDAPAVAWDPVRSVVVTCYSATTSKGYGVFTLDSLDQKIHLDTPNLVTTDKDWARIQVHPQTGDYFLFVVASSTDGGYGRVAYTRYARSVWNSTLTTVDPGTTNQGLVFARTATTVNFDALYVNGTSSKRQLFFLRAALSQKAMTSLDIHSNPNPSLPNSPVNLYGTLSLYSNGTILPQRTVILRESNDSITWTTITTTTTNATGQYAATIGLQNRGVYYLQAVFAGDSSNQLIASPDMVQGVGAFVFSAGGDLGANFRTTANLLKLGSQIQNFFLALGDLSYNETVPESSWCSYVRSKVGPNLPFEIISGNHEDGNEEHNGLIDNFAACLPDQIGTIQGTYGKEYYFDYPANNPLARLILISPALNFTNGGFYDYSIGSPHYSWLSDTIDAARAEGIPWVIVGMHKPCISIGQVGCDSGSDIMNLLIQKKVDLVLLGHSHSYERSKQLSCAVVNSYKPSCVVNDGSTGTYLKAGGTILIIQGTMGEGQEAINPSNPEAGYFTRAWGSNGYWNGTGTSLVAGATWGFVRYTVTPTQIIAQFLNTTGSFRDGFVISSPLTSSFTITPQFPISGSPVTFSGTVSGGKPPYSIQWDLGDGSTSTINPTTYTYILPGSYTVKLTATDKNNFVTTSASVVNVSPPLLTTFSFSPSIPKQGQPVTFTASATGGTSPYSFIWNFGDGSAGSGSSTTHTYYSSGTFTVILTAMDTSSPQQAAMSQQSVSVTNPATLTAGFSYSPSSLQLSQQVNFTAFAGGGTVPYSYAWSFGDGSAGTGYSVTHTYSLAGSYTVTVTVNDSGSPQQTAISQQIISVASPLPLSSGFIFTPSSPQVGQQITFTGSATGGTSPYSFSWSFGDGYAAAGTSITHAYSSLASYNVTLMTTDSAGQSVFTSVRVAVTLRDTSLTVSCPASGTVGVALTCSATVADISAGTASTPTGTVSFASNSTGTFGPSSCTLAGTATVGVASCSVGYTPAVTGHHATTGTYGGDSTHSGALGSATLTVAQTPPYALIVSYDGRVFKYYHNGTMTQVGRPVGSPLRQVAWKPDGSYALMVGDQGVILKYDGTVITRIATGFSATPNFNTVAWRPDGSYALIGGSGGILVRYDGLSVTQIPDPSTNTIHSISWNPNGNTALAVGDKGTTLLYQTTSQISILSSGTSQPLFTVVWNPNGLYALAGGGHGAVLKYDGAAFSSLNITGLTPINKNLRFISFSPTGTIAVIAGDSGLLWTYDGIKLASLSSGTSQNLYSISWFQGTAYIVGQHGTILSWSGSVVNKLTSSTSSDLGGIAWKPT